MLGGTVTRVRHCPACATAVHDRGARWCGSCGAPLEPAPEPSAAPPRGPPPRRLLVVAAVALAVGALVWAAVAGSFARDRPGTTVVRDAAVAAPDDAVLDRVERRGPTPVPRVEAPVCEQVDDDRCFLWVVEAAGGGFDAVTATDDRIVITQESLGGSLTVRDLDDGSVLWSAEVARGFSGDVPRVSGDLLLHVEEGELTGREVATGEVRWRTAELGRFAPWQHHRAGDVLVVAGESHRATLEAGGPPHAVAAGLDPATGAVLWREEARSATLAAGGAAVVISDEGQLRAYEPTGELRWEADQQLDVDGEASAWASGHLISLYDGDTRSQLHRLRDGAPLGYDGYPLVSDDVQTLAEVTGPAPGLALFDEDGEVWRTDTGVWDGCTAAAAFTPTTVELTSCDRGTLTLDRADGRLLTRTDVTGGEPTIALDGFGPVGPYVLGNEDPHRGGGDFLVTDVRTGATVARLPPDTWPVWHERGLTTDLGGVLVLQSQRWLTALPLPGPSVVGGVRRQ